MLHKLLVICLFVTINIIAMQKPAAKKHKNAPAHQPYEAYPDLAAGITPGYRWQQIQASHERDKQRLKGKIQLVQSKLDALRIPAKHQIETLLSVPESDPDTGDTPLHFAAANPSDIDLITELCKVQPQLKQKIDQYNNQGLTPFLVALLADNSKAFASLKALGANTSLPEKAALTQN